MSSNSRKGSFSFEVSDWLARAGQCALILRNMPEDNLHLPWLGNVLMRYEMQIKTAVKRCYFAVEPCIVYTTRQLLPVAKQDVLPAFHQSNIVYQFLCHCDSQYVGHTFQRLQQRIKQHVPKTILHEHISQDQST